VQWMWRLLFSALLCIPGIFRLVAGAWHDRPAVSSEARYHFDPQLYSSTGAAPTISLPKTEAGPVIASADRSDMALNTPAPASAPQPALQHRHSLHPRVGLWYAATPKQDAQTLPHWRLTARPGFWVPAQNQDSGG